MISSTGSKDDRPAFGILVPLDGSELAAHAMPVAEEMARQLGGELQLVQVLPFPVLPSMATAQYMPGEMYDEVAAEQLSLAQKNLGRYAAAAREHGVSKVNIYIERGDTASTLQEMTVSLKSWLVVMTTHGRTGLSRFVLGSVADHLVRGGTVPVLLVRSFPTGKSSTDLKRVLVPLDGSNLAGKALDFTLELAGSVVHEITLLHVVGPHEDDGTIGEAQAYLQIVRDRIIGQLSGRDCKVICQVLYGSPADSITECAEADGKVVIMATHAEAGIGRWVVGGTTDRVLHDGRLPLQLLVHPARD
jgi:nucleotide-binding universal stress UspA family protein